MEQKITIDTIYQKDFQVKPRGYDREEVDKFLDEIIEEMERLNGTITTLQEQLKEARQARPAPAAPTPVTAPVAPVADSTGSIQEVLAMAVKLKQDTLEEAQTKANAILAEAEQKANERLGSLNEEHARLSQELEALKASATSYRTKLEALLQEQKDAIEKAKELF